MTKSATAADVLLRAAEMADDGFHDYYMLIKHVALKLKVTDDILRKCNTAALFSACGNRTRWIDISAKNRVLALLFARELVLQGDV